MTYRRLLAEAVDVPGPWEHRRVAANGARFHVVEAGVGPLVLMLHGYPEFWWAWRHQVPALAGAGYRAVAMDLRGYGGSDKTPRGYDPHTIADDVAGVIRSLGEREAIVVGHGWGGMVAWATAVIRPAQVRAMAAISSAHPLTFRSALRGDPQQLRAARHLLAVQLPVLPERRLRAEGGRHVEDLLRRWAAPGSAFPDPETAQRYRKAIQIWPAPHCALEYHRWVFRSQLRADGRRFVLALRAPVAIPVLQIHGALDRLSLPRVAYRSRRYVTGPYRWVRLEDVGHFPHEEAPERVTHELLEWLNKLP